MHCWDTNYQLGCHAGATVLVRLVDDNQGDPRLDVRNTTGSVIVGATAANTTLGVCPVQPSPQKVFGGGVNIAGGTFSATHDPNGVGSTWAWNPTAGSELQSVTVTALEASFPASGNGIRVRFGQTSAEIWLVKGQSFTWSVAQHSANVAEFVDADFNVQCFGNSAANLIWTEQ